VHFTLLEVVEAVATQLMQEVLEVMEVVEVLLQPILVARQQEIMIFLKTSMVVHKQEEAKVQAGMEAKILVVVEVLAHTLEEAQAAVKVVVV
jgi:methionyl-tRNA synthetase